MKTDISNVMGKLTGLEIGKLKAKDYIGILTGIIPTYSKDDFDNAINKQDRDNKVKFLNYGHLSKELMIICLNYRVIVDQIEELSFKINWLRFYVIDYDGLLDEREEISKIYDTLKYGITQYFGCKDLIKTLSERLDFPELEAVISDDPLSSVELLNLWSMELPKNNPCKELFQAIDIESLKKIKPFDVKKKVDELMTWLD